MSKLSNEKLDWLLSKNKDPLVRELAEEVRRLRIELASVMSQNKTYQQKISQIEDRLCTLKQKKREMQVDRDFLFEKLMEKGMKREDIISELVSMPLDEYLRLRSGNRKKTYEH